ncbi:MAG: hypothetical protein IJ109_04640 [Firmicutes bacterium]|nr:hypothetical protein [Bacillota bacterium]
MNINDIYISTMEDLEEAVQGLGFLPYFTNSIPGFSIEEHVDPRVWFGDGPGTWEWKGPVIHDLDCAYGKFLERKAVYISRDWFPDFANYRRDGYDFDARYEDGLAAYQDKVLYELVERNGPVLSKRLKALGGYRKGGNKGFDTRITRLQSQGYVVISDFVYMIDKKGNEYGWGVAEYTTPEQFLGEAFTGNVYRRDPKESYERIRQHLHEILPEADDEAIRKILR